jgi:hypothetical protein
MKIEYFILSFAVVLTTLNPSMVHAATIILSPTTSIKPAESATPARSVADATQKRSVEPVAPGKVTLSKTISATIYNTKTRIFIPAGSKVSINPAENGNYVLEFNKHKYLVPKPIIDAAIVEQATQGLLVVATATQPEVCAPSLDDEVNIKIVPRLAWDPEGRKGFGVGDLPSMGGDPTRVTLHNTETLDAMAVRNGHKNRFGNPKKSDLAEAQAEGPGAVSKLMEKYRWKDIGYHFLIPPEPNAKGDVLEARAIDFEGAHAGGGNKLNIGIALIGDFNDHVSDEIHPHGLGRGPNEYQIATLKKLLKHLKSKYPDLGKLEGHRNVGTTDTDCPGEYAMYLLDLKYD